MWPAVPAIQNHEEESETMSTDFENLAMDLEIEADGLRELERDRSADLLMRAVAALREAVQHAPPPGWCWTELSRGDSLLTNVRRDRAHASWYLVREDGGATEGEFPTAHEAVAAFERDKQP